MGKKIKKTKRKLGIVARFLTSYFGQRFFNFAYSIGAAIVIWGALFKILHLPGGNTLLSIGMGTEVVMFLLTAFDRPPKEYKWEEVFPVLESGDEDDRPDFSRGAAVSGMNTGSRHAAAASAAADGPAEEPAMPTGTRQDAAGVRVESGDDESDYRRDHHSTAVAHAPYMPPATPATVDVAPLDLPADQAASLTESIAKMAAAADQLARMADLTTATQSFLDQMSQIAGEMQRLRDTTSKLNDVSDVLLHSYEAITRHSDEINESSEGYVDQMQSLNRNITGLNTIYEIQLKSVSSQLDAIDRVNRGIKDIRDMYEKSASQSSRYCEETEKMAHYMQQLNRVYEKMITAMTINMAPMMGQNPVQPAAPQQPAAEEYE